ncbi:MAG TPA: hypothetical protein PLO07_13530 [Rubrivivax sp.]|nr:hypothetical protein [Rubrivivax sp.]
MKPARRLGCILRGHARRRAKARTAQPAIETSLHAPKGRLLEGFTLAVVR